MAIFKLAIDTNDSVSGVPIWATVQPCDLDDPSEVQAACFCGPVIGDVTVTLDATPYPTFPTPPSPSFTLTYQGQTGFQHTWRWEGEWNNDEPGCETYLTSIEVTCLDVDGVPLLFVDLQFGGTGITKTIVTEECVDGQYVGRSDTSATMAGCIGDWEFDVVVEVPVADVDTTIVNHTLAIDTGDSIASVPIWVATDCVPDPPTESITCSGEVISFPQTLWATFSDSTGEYYSVPLEMLSNDGNQIVWNVQTDGSGNLVTAGYPIPCVDSASLSATYNCTRHASNSYFFVEFNTFTASLWTGSANSLSPVDLFYRVQIGGGFPFCDSETFVRITSTPISYRDGIGPLDPPISGCISGSTERTNRRLAISTGDSIDGLPIWVGELNPCCDCGPSDGIWMDGCDAYYPRIMYFRATIRRFGFTVGTMFAELIYDQLMSNSTMHYWYGESTDCGVTVGILHSVQPNGDYSSIQLFRLDETPPREFGEAPQHAQPGCGRPVSFFFNALTEQVGSCVHSSGSALDWEMGVAVTP
jgi:hypothetical protein